jgi:hypothetical protein
MTCHMMLKTFCVTKLENNSFSIQVDESNGFTNKSYVVRFVNYGEDQVNFFSVANEKVYLMSCFHI